MPDHWASRDLELAVKRGILVGDPGGDLRPGAPVIRAEAAIIANRLYDLTKEAFEHLITQIEPAVVMVVNEKTGALGSGSSIGGGLVLSNAHVVLNGDGSTNLQYGILWSAWGYGESGAAQYAMAELVHVAADLDLAVLRVGIPDRDRMPVLPLGDPDTIRKAEPVAVLGSPVGLIGSVSVGVVSYAGRSITYEVEPGRRVTIPDMIQTDAPINPGNSGGALVNRRGELIGVPSVKLVSMALEGLGFCIGLRAVRQALDRAGISLAPKPTMVRPDYEQYGWRITPAAHTMRGPVRWLVVHHEGSATAAGSNALAIHRYQVTKPDPYDAIGYHAVIERDGVIAEGRPLWARGAHVGAEYNDVSLGVCLVGNLDLAPPMPAQIESLLALLRWWRLLHPTAQVAGHRELPGILPTACPGRHLQLGSIKSQI